MQWKFESTGNSLILHLCRNVSIQDAKRKRKTRNPMDDQLIYGIHAVEEALDSGKPLNRVVISRDFRSATLSKLIKTLRQQGVPYQQWPNERMKRLPGKAQQGVVAWISPVELLSVEELVPHLFEQGIMPRLAVVEGVTDVRNIGAVARSAECFGLHGIVIPSKGVATLGADAVKSSAGALLKLPVCREKNLPVALEYLKQSGLQLIGLSEHAKKTTHELKLDGPAALVLGGEDEGMSLTVRKLLDEEVRIPMTGTIESLNVSVAAGIAFYAFSERQ